MQQKTKGEKYIKVKVFISYAVIFLLISSILYYTFDSFKKLTSSSDILAQPNKRIELLHDIVYSIYQAESNIRSYSLNEQEVFMKSYFDELIKINEMVDSLYILANDDEFIIATIDSINLQLLNKTRLLEQFIQIKKLDRNSVFYRSAIDEILQVTEEEKLLKEITHQSIIDNSFVPLPQKPEEDDDTVNEEKDTFFKKLRSFFSGEDKDQEPTVDPTDIQISDAQLMVREIRTDSIITVYHDTEMLKEEIENTMTNLVQTIIQKQKNIQWRENKILLEDKQVMDRIWEYITILEDYEKENAIIEAQSAHLTVNTTTRKIFQIVVASLLILMIFSWLFVNDVNRSRFYKKQLIEQKSRAEQLVELKQRFMANISHELRTPLNSIIGFSAQLRKKTTNSAPVSYLNAIHQSSKHLLEIINDILDFSKIEAGKVNLNIIPVNLSDLVEEVYNTLLVTASEKGLNLNVDASELKHPTVKCDPLRIRQVLLNIAGNAIKFTPSGGVKISVSEFVKKEQPDINYVRIKISDTGIGIPLTDQEHIFEEFSQSDNRATRSHGGTGLGLSISKKLVDLMNGHIELFSQPSKGSTFNIYIPMEIWNRPLDQIVEHDAQFADEMQANILLVDDDRLNRLLFKSILKVKPGIVFNEAENALLALELMKEQKFDLIITDIQMPGMSGVEMVRQVRENQQMINASTPVLACTADITPETLAEISASGMNDYILKPIDENLLVQKIIELTQMGQKPLEDHSNEMNNSNEVISGPQEGLLLEEKPYDLSALKVFTGNDPESVSNVLSIFLEDTKAHVQKLEKCLSNGNAEETFAIVHKMSNMFGLLKAQKVNHYLIILNKLNDGRMSNSQMKTNIRSLIQCTKELISAMEKDVLARS